MSDAWNAAWESVAVVDLDRDVVEAAGPDAASFLHGQLSQGVEAMADGETRWSFLLQPQGKVEAIVRLTRTAPERFVLDTEGGYGSRVVESLARFRLRTRVDLTPLAWRVVGLRGPEAGSVAAQAELDLAATGGRDLLGPDPVVPPELPRLGLDEAEALRILYHQPRLGVDVDESTIPQETGLTALLVDFGKGCYRGQELVERIHSRGAVRRVLQRGEVDGSVAAGAEVEADGTVLGRITSAAAVPGTGRTAFLALVRTDADPDRLTVEGRPVTWSADTGPQ